MGAEPSCGDDRSSRFRTGGIVKEVELMPDGENLSKSCHYFCLMSSGIRKRNLHENVFRNHHNRAHAER
jgi:hypothetical protein